MVRLIRYTGCCLSLFALVGLIGCGGSEAPPPVAQAPTPAASNPAPSDTSANSEEESSSDESYSDESYSGESYSEGGNTASSEGGNSGEEGYDNASSYQNEMASSSDEESGSMDQSSYGMGMGMGMPMGGGEEAAMPMDYGMMAGMTGANSEESGYGMPGMMGMGGAPAGPSFNGLAQFVKQNCAQCHGEVNPKGNVSLLSLSDDFMVDAVGWNQVVEQLESGAMPPKNSRRPDPAQQELFVSFIKEQLSTSGGDQPGYLARAQHYFGSGKEGQAMKFVLAHALVADDAEAAELLSKTRWFPLEKRLVTTLRFGAGVVLNAPSNVTDLKPVGSKQFGGGGGGGGDSAGPAMMSRGGPPGQGEAGEDRTFYDMTGDLGEALAAAFASRWAEGRMGTVFNDAAASEAALSVTTVASAGPAAGGYGGYGESMGGMGDMGMSVPGMESGYGGGYGEGGGGGAPEKVRPVIREGQLITTGLVFLGTGSQLELQERAAEAGLDGVFIFDVKATKNPRNGIVNNETKIRLTVGSTVVASSASIVNTEAEREEMRGGEDGVSKAVDKMFGRFDSEVQLTELPALQAQHAKARIHQLVNDKQVDPLQTLYETRLFQSQGLISQDDMATVFQIVLRGNEGLALATGTPADRMLIMEEVLEKL